MSRNFGQYVKTKKAYKEAGSMNDRVRVYCRLRPSLEGDSNGNGNESNQAATFITGGDGGDDSRCIDSYDKKGGFVYRKVDGELKQFQYDKFFPPESSQSDVYKEVGADVVQDVMEGYNGTIFAYGQTGTGKTFTMMGPEDGRDFGASGGIIPRAFNQVFDTVNTNRGTYTYQLTVSYVQIYCELLTDLLRPESELGSAMGIRESSVPGSQFIFPNNLLEPHEYR